MDDKLPPTAPFVSGTSLSELPANFPDHEILSTIGRGGMGVVYKARQVSLDRIVALKIIRTAEAATPTETRRFQKEAEAAARLDHSGIVPIFQIGEHQGLHYFSMALVEGPNLATVVKKGALLPRQAAMLVQQIAEAVHYAHTKGIIHRDLKPENVLLDPIRWQPKVADFGLAKYIEKEKEHVRLSEASSDSTTEQIVGASELRLTSTGQILGISCQTGEGVGGMKSIFGEKQRGPVRLCNATVR